MYENIVNKQSGIFYAVNKEKVLEAQKNMGVIIPDDLLVFYDEVGYGFLASKEDYFNRIMDPNSICDFRLRKGMYANNSELEMYSDNEKDKLVFFEICEDYFLSIGFSKNNYGKIFDGEVVIADNLEQFLIKYQENERYFDEMS